MDSWNPVIYRGDGAWVGRTASGELGVGTEHEERASLKNAGMRPMWPFMEGGLAECREKFEQYWADLRSSEFTSPDELFTATIATAWRSGSQYWMLLSVKWLIEVGRTANFEGSLLTDVRAEMLASRLVDDEMRMLI